MLFTWKFIDLKISQSVDFFNLTFEPRCKYRSVIRNCCVQRFLVARRSIRRFVSRLSSRMWWNLWSGRSFENQFVQTTLRTTYAARKTETRLPPVTDDDVVFSISLVYLCFSCGRHHFLSCSGSATRKSETSNSKGYFEMCVAFILQYFSSSVLVEKSSTFGGRAERTTKDMRWELTEDDWWSRWSNVLQRQTNHTLDTLKINWPYHLGVGTRFLQLHPPNILQQVYTRGWCWYLIPRPSERKPANSVSGQGRSFQNVAISSSNFSFFRKCLTVETSQSLILG